MQQLSTRVITPRLPAEPKYVAEPPKRFAQGIGAGFSLTALFLAFVLRRTTAAYVLIGVLGVFATLESVFSLCVGCKLFALLMHLGLVPEEVCVECANIWERPNLRANAPISRQPTPD